MSVTDEDIEREALSIYRRGEALSMEDARSKAGVLLGRSIGEFNKVMPQDDEPLLK